MDVKLLAMRDTLMTLYGLDIDDATVHFTTQNYAFVFPDKPHMIRVSIESAKPRQETMSEVLWVEDLKQFSACICEPSTDAATATICRTSPRAYILASGYMPDKSRRDALYRGILPYFKIGYGLHMAGDEAFWSRIELFLRDRQCLIVSALSTIEQTGYASKTDALRSAMQIPLTCDDILDELNQQLKHFSLGRLNK